MFRKSVLRLRGVIPHIKIKWKVPINISPKTLRFLCGRHFIFLIWKTSILRTDVDIFMKSGTHITGVSILSFLFPPMKHSNWSREIRRLPSNFLKIVSGYQERTGVYFPFFSRQWSQYYSNPIGASIEFLKNFKNCIRMARANRSVLSFLFTPMKPIDIRYPIGAYHRIS